MILNLHHKGEKVVSVYIIQIDFDLYNISHIPVRDLDLNSL